MRKERIRRTKKRRSAFGRDKVPKNSSWFSISCCYFALHFCSLFNIVYRHWYIGSRNVARHVDHVFFARQATLESGNAARSIPILWWRWRCRTWRTKKRWLAFGRDKVSKNITWFCISNCYFALRFCSLFNIFTSFCVIRRDSFSHTSPAWSDIWPASLGNGVGRTILRLHLGHIVLITGLAYCKTHRRWMRARRKRANFLSPKIQQGSVLLPLRFSLPGGPVVG